MLKSVTGADSGKQQDVWSAGRRTWLSASQRVLRAAEGVVSDALLELEQHVGGPRRGAQATRRMHEVVHRDRAAVSASRRGTVPDAPPTAAPSEPTAATAATRAVVPARAPAQPGDEPIRTRTYARLLAAQGETQRALALYVRLMEDDPRDVALAVEASELRRALELDQPF